jgi:hypothetical protein
MSRETKNMSENKPEAPAPEFEFRQGSLSVRLTQWGETQATMHTSGRELTVEVKQYNTDVAGDPKKKPFSTVDFICDGGRVELFLSDTQLEELACQLAAEIEGRKVLAVTGGDFVEVGGTIRNLSQPISDEQIASDRAALGIELPE